MPPNARRCVHVAVVLLVAALLFTVAFTVMEKAAYKRCGLEPGPSPSEYPMSEYPMAGASAFHLEQGATGFTCVYHDGPVERLHLGWFNA